MPQTIPALAVDGELPADVTAALTALRATLETAWSRQGAAAPDRWRQDRPSTGQCAITAMIVQDRFGGELLRTVNAGDSHYCNRLGDTVVDLTRDQFDDWDPEPFVVRGRDYLDSFPETLARYHQLLAALG